MRFEDVHGRFQGCQLSCEDAADLLGVSVSTFFRYRGRYEADGAAGLYDRRLGRASARRAPVGEAAGMLVPGWTSTFDRRLSIVRSGGTIYWVDAVRGDGQIL